MKKYNVGIIGYGWVAGAHIGAINASQHAQVTAVYSSRGLDSAKLSAQHGSSITAYKDLKKMLANPDIDVVAHLAGQVSLVASIAEPRYDFETNALGTFNVLEAMRRFTPRNVSNAD